MTTKNLMLGFILTLATHSLFAQKETGEQQRNGDVVFEDGTVFNFKMIENDPSVHVDWTAMGVFRPTYFERYVGLTLGVKGSVSLWDRVEARGMVSGGFHVDVSMPDDEAYKSFKKQYQHHFLETSIKLFESESINQTSILLGESNTGYITTSYFVTGKLKYKASYGVVVGIDYTRRRVGSDQYYEGPVADTNVWSYYI